MRFNARAEVRARHVLLRGSALSDRRIKIKSLMWIVHRIPGSGPRTMEVKLADAESKLPVRWRGTQAYGFDGEVAGKAHELILVPFSDACTYRVWLRKP